MVEAISSPQLQLGAIAGLANLVADCPENQSALLETDFVSVITPLLESFTDDKKEQALRIIMHLSSNEEHNHNMVYEL